MASAASNDIRVAVRHARLRWVGAPLLLTGGLLAVLAFLTMASGGSGWTVMLGCFGMGTALASFGSNHDTAMAHAIRVRTDPNLPDGLREEVEAELAKDRSEMLSLRPSAIAGLMVPVLSVGVQGYVAWQLLGA
jgi:hypothetical protein